MPFHKITKPFNTVDQSILYFGCAWERREDGVYADVPKYAIEAYVKAGRVEPLVEKKVEKPKVEEVIVKNVSAEDVVSGNTESAIEKKEARAEKAKEASEKLVEKKRHRRTKAEIAADKENGK